MDSPGDIYYFVGFPRVARRCDPPDEGGKLEGRPSVRGCRVGRGAGQFCPRRAMLGAIDHAISVVRQDRMAERVDNWTPTTPEVRVMTLEGGHAKTAAPRQPPHPSRFHLRCLWRGTHKKEYVTSTDNSRFSLSLSLLGLAATGSDETNPLIRFFSPFSFPSVVFFFLFFFFFSFLDISGGRSFSQWTM